MRKSEVKIGDKSKSVYIYSACHCIEKFGRAELRGLGQRQSKVFEIAKLLERDYGLKITGICGIYIDDTPGIEVVVESKGGSK